MNRLFDPDSIKSQIVNLRLDRDRIDQAIAALDSALRSIEGLHQIEIRFDGGKDAEITLQDAVKRVCMNMVDAITRQRVLSAIEKDFPSMKPISSSVSAALINLAQGENPMLKVAIEGQGRAPTFYSTEGNTVVKLSADEIQALLDENNIKGTGGWQSLFAAMKKHFNATDGTISLTPHLRSRLYHYYHTYGGGGWQNKAKRIFRRELPHLFESV